MKGVHHTVWVWWMGLKVWFLVWLSWVRDSM